MERYGIEKIYLKWILHQYNFTSIIFLQTNTYKEISIINYIYFFIIIMILIKYINFEYIMLVL